METTRYPLTVEHTPVLIRSSRNFDENKLFKVGKTIIEGREIKMCMFGHKVETDYKNCKFNGTFTAWYKNGQKECEGNNKDGKNEGLFVGWYSDGQKRYEVNYKDDQRNGVSVWWYSNGQKMSEKYFKNGMLDGLVIIWEEDGNIVYQKIYKDDKEV